MDEFIGHLDGERIQTLENHLAETARLAGLFAEAFGMKEAGVLLGKNHDLGKYSSSFQAYIRGKKKRGGDHSTAGPGFCGIIGKSWGWRPWQGLSALPVIMQGFLTEGRRWIPVKSLPCGAA